MAPYVNQAKSGRKALPAQIRGRRSQLAAGRRLKKTPALPSRPRSGRNRRAR